MTGQESLFEARYRCAECGGSNSLYGAANVCAFGPIATDGLLEHYDDFQDDPADVHDGSIFCIVHPEATIWKQERDRCVTL